MVNNTDKTNPKNFMHLPYLFLNENSHRVYFTMRSSNYLELCPCQDGEIAILSKYGITYKLFSGFGSKDPDGSMYLVWNNFIDYGRHPLYDPDEHEYTWLSGGQQIWVDIGNFRSDGSTSESGQSLDEFWSTFVTTPTTNFFSNTVIYPVAYHGRFSLKTKAIFDSDNAFSDSYDEVQVSVIRCGETLEPDESLAAEV